MAIWKAPLREYRFVLQELIGLDEVTALPGFGDATPDVFDAVLEEAGKLCEEVLLPINRSGDEEGCRLENGQVITPSGFKEAYKQFAEGGWTSLSADPEYGGQGLPHLLGFVVEEMLCAANHAFAMYPGLGSGAYQAILQHGSDEQRATYLPKLVSGEWLGTMALTEPQCGTDLGLIRTRAEPAADGSYRLTGTKIFISAGDHDLTENIIHLVLARLPDAPPGTRGLSLFLVPKELIDPETGAKTRNTAACGSIEHKMGIKASSTCVMNFDGATGWLIGEAHKGMRAMFTMMNVARLGVGIQGIGHGEVALQAARAYANDRLQGRAVKGQKYPGQPADPIIVHADVRRMLLTIRAYTEGGRALAAWIGKEVDLSHRHPDPEMRAASDDLVALMTPIAKAYLTDTGFESAVLAQQIYGGHGYIREWGVEQNVRDARISQIYEGTNGVQALDLVGRKLPMGTGRLLRRFFHPVGAYLTKAAEDSALAELALPALKAFGRLQQVTALVAEKALADPDEGAAAAHDYLRLFALTALAYLWTRMGEIALKHQDSEEADFYKGKLAVARFFMTRLLPQATAHAQAIQAGAAPIMGLEDALV